MVMVSGKQMGSALRLLHLIPTLEGGGAERQLSMLAVEQSSRGYDVHLGIRRGGVYEDMVRGSRVVVHFLGDHRGISPLLLAGIKSLLRKVKPDVVQTWLPQMDIVGGMATLWKSIPWIASERASGFAYQHMGLQALIRGLLIRHASAVVANSADGAEHWRGKLLAAGRVFQVSNAVDVDAIRDAQSWFITSNAKAIKKNILVVGRLDREKAVEVIIEAFSRISNRQDYRVLIIGDGPLHSNLKTLISRLRLNGHIVMIPYRSDWWGLLKAATAVVSMSRYEGQPNVILEAMAAGCPLVVSDIPGHRQLLNEDSAILVEPDNPIALASALDSLLLDLVAANKRAGSAASRVSGLTIYAMADAYEAIYNAAIADRRH